MFGFKKKSEERAKAIQHEIGFERIGDSIAIRHEEGTKVTMLFSPANWGGNSAVNPPWIHKREFPSMTALKRWCRVHHPCKFWPTQVDKKVETVAVPS